MKRLLILLILLFVAGLVAGPVMAGAFGPGTDPEIDRGPAPNAGDGDPDGSGWDNYVDGEVPYGFTGYDEKDDSENGKKNGDSSGIDPGPAPNSGDGIPDGSGK